MNQSKALYIIALLLIATSCKKEDEDVAKEIPCIPSALANNVIAFYPFSNGSLNDVAGNSQHLSNTTIASATSDRNGNENCAYEFVNLPTSSEFLTTTNTAFLDGLSEFSVSLWYQPKDPSRNDSDFESLMNRDLVRSCPDRMGQWSVGLYDCRKATFGRTNSVWDKGISGFDCDQEIIDRTDVWHHLVATFNDNGVKMKLYRNGALQDSSTGAGECSDGTPSYQDIGGLFLGKDYTGKIDDVMIFNKTLSELEVNTLFGLETCCETP